MAISVISRKSNLVLTSRMNERALTASTIKSYSLGMDMVGKRMPSEPEILGAGTWVVSVALIVTSRSENYVLTSR